MTQPTSNSLELTLTRTIPVTPDKLFRCWTEPALITQWFTPPPFTTTKADIDLRIGGASHITMRSPEGQEFPNVGTYLEIIPNQKLVITDAYTGDWQPSAKPFITIILTFEDLGNGSTLYTARVRHWTKEDYDTHVQMGFHSGWSTATDQLTTLAQKLGT